MIWIECLIKWVKIKHFVLRYCAKNISTNIWRCMTNNESISHENIQQVNQKWKKLLLAALLRLIVTTWVSLPDFIKASDMSRSLQRQWYSKVIAWDAENTKGWGYMVEVSVLMTKEEWIKGDVTTKGHANIHVTENQMW